MEIIVFHPGGLGDIILSLPAVALLRRRYAGARITVAANLDHLAPVSEGYADRVVSLSSVPLQQLYTRPSSFKPEEPFWKKFDLVVSWTGFGDLDFMRNLKKVSPRAIIASWHPAPRDPRHVSRLFLDSLGSSTCGHETITAMEAKIHLDSNASRKGLQWLYARGWNDEPLIALHPGAGSKAKRWPLERFIELARRLTRDRKNRLLVIEGPAEEGLAHQIPESLPGMDIIVAEDVSLKLLAAVVRHCRLFVGNDSGLAHLAAALNIPSIVLFGPTQPRHWAPLGKHVAVLRESGGCPACASAGGVHTCLLNVSVTDVLEKIGDVPPFSRSFFR